MHCIKIFYIFSHSCKYYNLTTHASLTPLHYRYSVHHYISMTFSYLHSHHCIYTPINIFPIHRQSVLRYILMYIISLFPQLFIQVIHQQTDLFHLKLPPRFSFTLIPRLCTTFTLTVQCISIQCRCMTYVSAPWPPY